MGRRQRGKTASGKNKGAANIKQPHLKYTCQEAVIVPVPPAEVCTLPDPRPVKYSMLDQKGVFLCPKPDPRSVIPLLSRSYSLRSCGLSLSASVDLCS